MLIDRRGYLTSADSGFQRTQRRKSKSNSTHREPSVDRPVTIHYTIKKTPRTFYYPYIILILDTFVLLTTVRLVGCRDIVE